MVGSIPVCKGEKSTIRCNNLKISQYESYVIKNGKSGKKYERILVSVNSWSQWYDIVPQCVVVLQFCKDCNVYWRKCWSVMLSLKQLNKIINWLYFKVFGRK